MAIVRGARAAVAAATLAVLAARPASAQVCAGLPPLSERPVIVTADFARANDASSVGAGLTVGRRAFVGAFAERAAYRNVSFAATQAGTHSTNIGGGVGYEFRLGRAGLCPVATGEWDSGPDGDFSGTPLDSDSWTVGAGLSAGAVLLQAGPWRVIPYVNATIERVSSTVHDFPFRGTDSRVHDTVWVFGFGVGVALGPRLTVAPSLSIPSGIEGGETTFGLSVNVGLGR